MNINNDQITTLALILALWLGLGVSTLFIAKLIRRILARRDERRHHHRNAQPFPDEEPV